MASGSPSQHHRRATLDDLPGRRESLAEQCRYGPLVLTDSGEDVAVVVSLDFLHRALGVLHGNREVRSIADFTAAEANLLRQPTAREKERGVWDDEEPPGLQSPRR